MPEEVHDEPYVPPISKMHVVMYFIVFVIWGLVMVINTSKIETDPYFVWGLVLLLIWTYTFEVVLPRAKNRSPKGVSNVLADSVVSGPPQRVIKAQGAFPDMGVWVAGAVDAPRWGLKFFATATGYIIAPLRFAYEFGPNWVWNVDFDNYVDHGRLPPHVKDALERMDDPAKYKAEIPVAFGLYPKVVHELSESDRFELKKDLERLEYHGPMDGMMNLVEKYAGTVSPFKYDDSWLDVRTLHKLQMDQISKAYDDLKAENRHQQDLTKKWKMASLKPQGPPDQSIISKIVKGNSEEEDEQP